MGAVVYRALSELPAGLGLAVGHEVVLRTFTPAQFGAFGDGPPPEPAGPSVAVRVVGIVRSTFDVSDEVSGNLPNAVAVFPARAAARTNPALALRKK